ncbi:hypothetical protein ACT9TU_16735 [Raoultella planticola]|uniref:hypothetical protein n=1 Tax=Raoultella planticola TaxID=575 RepID=UPI00406894FA
MSLDLYAKNTRLSSAPSKFIKSLPVMDGIKCINFAGATLVQNQLRNGDALSIFGAPVQVTDYSSRLIAQNSVLTPFLDFEEATFIIVLRAFASGTGSNSTLAGIYPNTGQTARGFGIGLLSSGGVFASASAYSGAEGAATSNILATIAAAAGIPTTWDTGEWRCIAGKVWIEDGRVMVKIMDLTKGTSAQSQSVAGLVRDMRNGSQVMSIGQGRGSGQDTVSYKEMASTFIYNRALSDSEIALNYDFLKTYFEYRDVYI